MNKIFWIFATAAGICMTSCYNTHEITPDKVLNADTLNIFKIGRVLEYRVDSTFYLEVPSSSTLDSERKSTFYIREEIYDTIRDSEGNLVYLVDVSKKNSMGSDYFPELTYSYTLKGQEVVWNTRNAPMSFLNFPLLNRAKWIANKYTNTDLVNVADLNANTKSWNAEVLDLDSMYSYPYYFEDSTTNFESPVIYFQLADIFDGGSPEYTDLIDFKYMIAPNIGVVYKHEQAYVLRSNITYRRGFEINYYLIGYE